MICWENDGRFWAICCCVIAEEQVRPWGCVRMKPELGGVDGFINHSQAEADKGSIYYESSVYSGLGVFVVHPNTNPIRILVHS